MIACFREWAWRIAMIPSVFGISFMVFAELEKQNKKLCNGRVDCLNVREVRIRIEWMCAILSFMLCFMCILSVHHRRRHELPSVSVNRLNVMVA